MGTKIIGDVVSTNDKNTIKCDVRKYESIYYLLEQIP